MQVVWASMGHHWYNIIVVLSTYLLLAECKVHTASYGLSFFPSFHKNIF